MLENNPAGHDRAEVERIVGNRYHRLLRQQHDSKALSESGRTTTADHGEKKRRPQNLFEGICFNCGRKYHRAEISGARRRRQKKVRRYPRRQEGRR